MTKEKKPSVILGCLPLVIALAGIVYGLMWFVERQEDSKPYKSSWNKSQAHAEKYRSKVRADLSFNARESGRVFIAGTLSNRGNRDVRHVRVKLRYRTIPANAIETATVSLGAVSANTTRRVSVRLPRANVKTVVVNGGLIGVEVYNITLAD